MVINKINRLLLTCSAALLLKGAYKVETILHDSAIWDSRSAAERIKFEWPYSSCLLGEEQLLFDECMKCISTWACSTNNVYNKFFLPNVTSREFKAVKYLSRGMLLLLCHPALLDPWAMHTLYPLMDYKSLYISLSVIVQWHTFNRCEKYKWAINAKEVLDP